MELKFRDLRADEIDCRVDVQSDNGISLLLYKDARCDMNILDETVGALNWQRRHLRDNANCIVSIWDPDKEQWIEKEDTGTESKMEAGKGLCSDSFKRSCTNFGIGRELYTSPFIWVDRGNYSESTGRDGKVRVTDKFTVSRIEIENKRITDLEIVNSKGKTVFQMRRKQGKAGKAKKTAESEIISKIRTLDGAINDARPEAKQDYIAYCMKKLNLPAGTEIDSLQDHDLKLIHDLMVSLYNRAMTAKLKGEK